LGSNIFQGNNRHIAVFIEGLRGQINIRKTMAYFSNDQTSSRVKELWELVDIE
jgi:hypothetical protein